MSKITDYCTIIPKMIDQTNAIIDSYGDDTRLSANNRRGFMDIHAVLMDLQAELNAEHADMIPNETLEEAYTLVQEISKEIKGYTDNREDAHISTAEYRLTKVRDIISEINSLKEGGSSPKSPDEQYRTALDKMYNLLSKFEDDSKLLLSTSESALKEQTGKSEKIVSLISNNIVPAQYSQEANHARKRVFRWNLIVLATLIIVAVFTFFFFRIYTSNDLHWVNLVSKVLITAPIASLTAYAARQVTKYEKVERAARRTELELAAFDPFISNLDDNLKSELKVEITKRLFGNTENAGEKDSYSKAITAEDIMKLLLNITTKK